MNVNNTNNNQNNNKNQNDQNNRVDYKYEYGKIQLIDLESKYIYIPLSLIINNEADVKRVSVFSYFRIHCGLNDLIGFNVPDLVTWCGMKPNNREGKANDKFLSIINNLSTLGYLTYLTNKDKNAYMKCKFDMEYYYKQCSEGYSVIYLDELQKIMDYKNLQGNSIDNAIILLVLAYFRNKIIRRPNELNPEERTFDGIMQRRERLPEAIGSNITTIAKELGLHKQTLSKAIDILEYDLKMIVTDRAYRVKNEDGEFRTLPTIFANAYKREDRYLLNTEKDYSRIEIELKAENLKQYYHDYKIDKRKRKE